MIFQDGKLIDISKKKLFHLKTEDEVALVDEIYKTIQEEVARFMPDLGMNQLTSVITISEHVEIITKFTASYV